MILYFITKMLPFMLTAVPVYIFLRFLFLKHRKIMFMPFGFFPALLWKNFSLAKALLLGAACSVFIELMQLFLPRDTNIDDVLLNALGAAAGYLLYMLIAKRFQDKLDLYK